MKLFQNPNNCCITIREVAEDAEMSRVIKDLGHEHSGRSEIWKIDSEIMNHDNTQTHAHC
jgi:hypothetical protein